MEKEIRKEFWYVNKEEGVVGKVLGGIYWWIIVTKVKAEKEKEYTETRDRIGFVIEMSNWEEN